LLPFANVKVNVQFVTSAADVKQFPPTVAPEVAFLGRSNVGKSSLLNSLTGSRIAHVSSSPGRTRTINFFAISWEARSFAADLMLVDLPGYGYAKVSKSIRAEWPKFIEPYLRKRSVLALCVVLLDSGVEPQLSDKRLIDFLRASGRDFVAVATKADRLSKNHLHFSLKRLGHEHALGRILPYSAKTNAGREELWREIRHATAKTVTAKVADSSLRSE
jgi:GTP-binding protein